MNLHAFTLPAACLRLVCGFVSIDIVCIAEAGELSLLGFDINGGGGLSAGGSFSVRGKVARTSPTDTLFIGGSFSLKGFFSSVAVVDTEGSPRLALRRTANGYEISWPLPADGFVLQETIAIGTDGATDWSNANATIADQGGRRTASILANGPMRYFRLTKPAS